MKTITFAVLMVVGIVAGMNTFGRAAINDYNSAKVAEEYTQRKATQLAEDIKACASGKTTLIMVAGKFCHKG
ncbi:hypothetical protein PMW_53 [Pseudomonas phage phiPMW]|uniref:Uncharacterized protein n=1 Tax=Pseudomonas phage phiPMW TaxID=1815582 RepID=A0A1S5R1C2_9CAUD|nr:hypothetical protein FDG97_gp053 [Pseudomonas phage phiPMW]ANA49178.1 hypothetical protein PMW_53 [Pseudomonas phage phiPMW]